MQSVQTLLDHLKQQDINLYIEGDRLRCNAPKDRLTPSLQAHLSERKSEILDFLRRQISLDAIVPQPESRYQPFPLTDIQQAYWLGRQEGLELGGISAHFYWELETQKIEVKVLEQAWQRLLERHEMLRAVIEENGQQRILETVPPYVIPIIDLQGETAQTQRSRLQEIRDRLSHQVLPCDRWPLFELLAVRLDAKTIHVCLSFDLLLGDALSMQILMAELAQFLYQPTLTLPPLELSFRDCVLAERAARHSDRYQHDRDYWQTRLETLPPPPELPLQINPATLCRTHFTHRYQQFPPEVWQKLKRKARLAQLTPSGVLLAAFAEVLATWSRNPHFTLNLTLVNRPPLHPEIGQIIGDFTSITLLEANCAGEQTFVARSQRLQKQLWQDLDRKTYSGVQVLRELARRSQRRSAALMPIVFTSALALGQQGRGEENQKSVLLQDLGDIVYMISQTPQVYLDSQISEEAGSLVIYWDAVEALFPQGLLDDMFAAYGDFLQRLADEDEVWTAKTQTFLPLPQQERLQAINNTNTDELENSTLLQTLFFQQAIAHPERTAVIAGDCVLTYGELSDRVLTVAHQLREKGARPNELIAIVMEKGWEQVVATLAILTAGSAYVPIDPELPEQRRSYLCAEAEVRWILTQSKFEESLNWPENIERLWVDAIEPTPSCPLLEPQQTAEDLAYVIYTSGSTGLPKGVAIEHRGAVNTILDINQRFGVTENDRVLAVSSLSFDLSVYDIFGILAAGGTMVAIAPQATKDPSHWIELIQQHGITLWNSVPALMQMLLDYTAVRSDFNLSSLRLTLLSGDWIPLTLPERIQTATGGRVISLGGATEASIWSIFYPIETVDPAWKSIPYGRPLANQHFYVLDETLEPRPFWVPGQLYIGGIGLAREYWRNQEKTARSFITHPKPGERLYKTGDLGRYLPDGNIEFIGREDSQVKVNGYRIELGEIEAILQQHPAIKETVVMAMGESGENKQLAAYIVPNLDSASGQSLLSATEEQTMQESDGSDLQPSKVKLFDPGKLRWDLQQKLPDYMIPAHYILLDVLPLTPNGKVDRRSLPQPQSLQDNSQDQKDYVAPRTQTERLLADIWMEVIKIDKVSIHANFFEIGGDSLLNIQIVTRASESNLELKPQHIFQFPTIAELAVFLEDALVANRPLDFNPLIAIKPSGSKPPLFCIHASTGSGDSFIEMSRYLDYDRPLYALQARGFDGELKPLSTIEEMAAFYLQAIQTVQPIGPYYLCGWSMGGIVAYEIAQQLVENNLEVEFLGLIDIMADERDLQLELLRKTHPNADVTLQNISQERQNIIVKLIEINGQAMLRYQLKPFSGKATIFKAKEQPKDTPDSHKLGWDKYVLGEVKLYEIPGNHYSIMNAPNVQILSQKLMEIF